MTRGGYVTVLDGVGDKEGSAHNLLWSAPCWTHVLSTSGAFVRSVDDPRFLPSTYGGTGMSGSSATEH